MILDSIRKNKLFVGLLGCFLCLLLHPLSRPVIMVILPLGSGPDDLIVGALFVLFVILWKGLK